MNTALRKKQKPLPRKVLERKRRRDRIVIQMKTGPKRSQRKVEVAVVVL